MQTSSRAELRPLSRRIAENGHPHNIVLKSG
jgi:hypothetical protein